MSRKRTKIWTTRDGQKIRVCDMDDGHLQNTINFLERWTENRRKAALADAMTVANCVTADIASDCAEDALDDAIHATREDYVPDIYYDMANELRDRNAAVSV